MYNSNIIGFATNGAINYTEESKRENEILEHTASILESAISNIGSMNSGASGSTEEPEPPPVEEPEVGIDFGEMTEEQTKEYVGKFVNYVPTSGSFTSEGQYNGKSNQNFSTDISIKWKILFLENNRITLISDKAVNSGFTLYSYNGYNNGVLLLNKTCEALYSNLELGATAKSLNLNHIEKVSSYVGASNKEYSPSERYYPNIYVQEEQGAPQGSYKGIFGKSEQSDYITGYKEGGTSFKGKETAYTYIMSNSYMEQIYVDLFKSSTDYLLASRCVKYDGVYYDEFWFSMFCVSGTAIENKLLLGSSFGVGTITFAIRPIVEIDLTKVNVGVTGSGAENDGYSLTLK